MILIIEMNWKKDSLGYFEFVLPLVSIAQQFGDCQVEHFSEVDSADIERSDNIILSGSALKDNATVHQPEKFTWLKTVNKPVLGICAGMETIAQVHGIEMRRCVEIGMVQIHTVKENTLFSGTFTAYSLHSYCTRTSADFDVLAESESSVQAIKHKQKPIYGLLFHPEVRNQDILKRFLRLKR